MIRPLRYAACLPVLLAPQEGPGPADERPPVGGWSGAIDLLYRDPASRALVVADYKTDDVGEGGAEARAAAYAQAGAVYTAAVESALELPERPRFELWFLRAGRVVPVDPSLA